MSMYVLNCLTHLDPPRPKYIGPIMELGAVRNPRVETGFREDMS